MTQEIPPSKDELLIAAYLWGDLSNEEKVSFEARLESDLALREELEFQRSVQLALNRERLGRAFQRNLEAASQEIAARKSARPYLWRRLVSTLLLALLAGIVGFLVGQKLSQQPPMKKIPDTPIAQQSGDEDEPLVGVGKTRFPFMAPLLRLTPAIDSMEIVLVEGGQQKAILEQNVLALQYLPGQMPDVNNIRLIELTLGGRQVLYLKMGKKFYPIREGEQALEEEKDEEVLKWLE